MIDINIQKTNLSPSYTILTGNNPLYLTIYESNLNGTIEEIDKADKLANKAMFDGHFYIRKNGIIYEGRKINEYGQFSSFYVNNIGICLEGSFNNEIPGDIQLNSLYNLIKYLKEKYSLIKLMYLIDLQDIKDLSPGAMFPFIEPLNVFYDRKFNVFNAETKGITYYRYGYRKFIYDKYNLMKGNDIYYLQGLLKKIGYDINLTGIYDKYTNDLIQNIKKENGYDTSNQNEFTVNEYKLIDKLYYNKLSEKGFTRILEMNSILMSGDDIEGLQSKLKSLGFNCNINSNYDKETKSAVEALQSQESIKIDGRVGPITFSSLNKKVASKFKRNLFFTYPNFYGEDVKVLQQKLNDIGFPCEINSKFDKNTENAIKGYQFKNQLNITGIVDIFIWNKLFG